MATTKSRTTTAANGSGYPPGIKAVLGKLDDIEAAIELLTDEQRRLSETVLELTRPHADRRFVEGSDEAEALPEVEPDRGPSAQDVITQMAERSFPDPVTTRQLMAESGKPRGAFTGPGRALHTAGVVEILDVLDNGKWMKAYRLKRPAPRKPRAS